MLIQTGSIGIFLLSRRWPSTPRLKPRYKWPTPHSVSSRIVDQKNVTETTVNRIMNQLIFMVDQTVKQSAFDGGPNRGKICFDNGPTCGSRTPPTRAKKRLNPFQITLEPKSHFDVILKSILSRSEKYSIWRAIPSLFPSLVCHRLNPKSRELA